MNAKFDAFVIFAEMRTGSNYLEATLNDLDGLHSYGEVYNPTFMGHHNTFDLFGYDMDAREKDPAGLFDAMLKGAEDLPGFRFFHDHDPRLLARILPDPRVAKIVLTRNPLDSYVSRKIATQTGQWRLTDVKQRRSARIRFKIDEFSDMLERLQSFQLELQHGLQITGQTAFYLRYEDINDVDVINGIAAFLGLKARLSTTSTKLKKQNPSDLEEKVENFAQMQTDLSRIDLFNLSQTPNFEPVRHAGVPGFQMLPDCGLMFMPIKGCAVEPVSEWLAKVGGIEPDALISGLNQKQLRQWLRTHPGHRSFSVVRHPLARAHDVFCNCILTTERPFYTNLRRQLRQKYKLPIPKKMPDDGYDLPSHQAAFLSFLHFLKGNLSGQTSIKVEPVFATQTASLQGMAQFALPDLLIRDSELTKTLPQLAHLQTGQDVAFTPQPEPTPFPLAQVVTPEIEEAALEAYRRDYINFGYEPAAPDQYP